MQSNEMRDYNGSDAKLNAMDGEATERDGKRGKEGEGGDGSGTQKQAGEDGKKRKRPQPWASRSVGNFEVKEQIGSGTYGHVNVARDKQSNEQVALKRIKLDEPQGKEYGFPVTAIREIKILSRLSHENIIQLKEIVTAEKAPSSSPAADDSSPQPGAGKSSIYMVFELMNHDLQGLLAIGNMQLGEIKCYMRQLLYALSYLHDHGVLHRDLKLSNILINKGGIVKLGDFGLARSYRKPSSGQSPGNVLTNNVVTMWYRPPEVLLGSQDYGPEVDVWSAGCILAELVTGHTLFSGETEPQQLELIFNTCGTPDEGEWPEVSKLPWWGSYKPNERQSSKLREKLSGLHPGTVEIVERMLRLNPKQRITARDAIFDDFFWSEPRPLNPQDVPKRENFLNEQAANKRREEKRRQRGHR